MGGFLTSTFLWIIIGYVLCPALGLEDCPYCGDVAPCQSRCNIDGASRAGEAVVIANISQSVQITCFYGRQPGSSLVILTKEATSSRDNLAIINLGFTQKEKPLEDLIFPVSGSNWQVVSAVINERNMQFTVKKAVVEPEDDGQYRCGSNQNSHFYFPFSVSVRYPPRNISINNHTDFLHVHVGSDVTLLCSAEGHDITYRWTKTLPGEATTHPLSDTGPSLTVTVLPDRQTDANYTCVSTNNLGSTNRSVSVNTLVPPKLLTESYQEKHLGTSGSGSRSDPLVFVAEFDPGFRKADVVCFKDTAPIGSREDISSSSLKLPDDLFVSVPDMYETEDSGPQRMRTYLRISQRTSEFLGLYKCEARNENGSAVADYRVLGQPFDVSVKVPVYGHITGLIVNVTAASFAGIDRFVFYLTYPGIEKPKVFEVPAPPRQTEGVWWQTVHITRSFNLGDTITIKAEAVGKSGMGTSAKTEGHQFVVSDTTAVPVLPKIFNRYLAVNEPSHIDPELSNQNGGGGSSSSHLSVTSLFIGTSFVLALFNL